MAVFTPLSLDDIGQWITQFPLGQALALKGIASGIENSNFFLTTERGDYVLTIFENLGFEQLPFYLQLMRHLAQRGVLVPAPVPNTGDQLCVALQGKPAAIVSKLDGSSQMAPRSVVRKKLLFSMPEAMPLSASAWPRGNWVIHWPISSRLSGVKTAIGKLAKL